jgi:hypothetical protein
LQRKIFIFPRLPELSLLFINCKKFKY